MKTYIVYNGVKYPCRIGGTGLAIKLPCSNIAGKVDGRSGGRFEWSGPSIEEIMAKVSVNTKQESKDGL